MINRLILILVVLLNSCNIDKQISSYDFNKLLYLKKGLSYKRIESIFELQEKYEKEVDGYIRRDTVINNNQYKIIILPIICYMSVGKDGRTGMTTTDVNQDNFYLYILNDELVYWGFQYEFCNSNDPYIKQFCVDVNK